MGIKDEDIIIIRDMTKKQIIEKHREVRLRVNKYSGQQQKVFLFSYCAGHGVQDIYQQFVLNSAQRNIYNIEEILRSMCGSSQGYLCVYSIYDMCRSNKQSFPELRGEVEYNREEEDFCDVNYIHVKGTYPGGVVPADSTMAVKLLRHLDAAARRSSGLLELPTVLNGLRGMVEKTYLGDTFKIIWMQELREEDPNQMEEQKEGNDQREEAKSDDWFSTHSNLSDYLETEEIQAEFNGQVREIWDRLGRYEFEQNFDNQHEQEQRPMVVVNDGSKYQGEWVKNTQIRQSRGIQLWPMSSTHECQSRDKIHQLFKSLNHPQPIQMTFQNDKVETQPTPWAKVRSRRNFKMLYKSYKKQQKNQIKGLGDFKSKALAIGKEAIKKLVDQDIERIRSRKKKKISKQLLFLLESFKATIKAIALSRTHEELPNSLPGQKYDDSSSEQQAQGNVECRRKQQIDISSWEISGRIASVGQKLGSLTDKQLCFKGKAQLNFFKAQDRLYWSRPLADDGSGGLSFSRIQSVADSLWLLKEEHEQWVVERQQLAKKIGQLSPNEQDEYFNMCYNHKKTVISLLRRVYEQRHHYAILKRHWKQQLDRLEVGYLLSGLMSWLNDQKIASLYVSALQQEVDFYKAMHFSKVTDPKEISRVSQYVESNSRTRFLMFIRLPDWHQNEPYKLEVGDCKIPTAKSRAMRELHQDLHETGAIDLMKHMALKSYFKFAHSNMGEESDVNPVENAKQTDQESTPKRLIRHISEVLRVPQKAIYDPYVLKKDWQNGHDFNAIHMHSKASLVEFINPAYSGAACHILTHAHLLVKSNTSAAFLVENQSVENNNLNWLLRALSTRVCAGHVKFSSHKKSHAKSMTYEYLLSPDLMEYREWLRWNKNNSISRRAHHQMLLKSREQQKKDIAFKLLQQGASPAIASRLAKWDKCKVLRLKKNMSPVFTVLKKQEIFKVDRIKRDDQLAQL